MKKLSLLVLILALIAISGILAVGVFGNSTQNEGYTIDGNRVYWEAENIGRMEVYPHTTYGSRHCYQVNITSYLQSQELDFAFQFDRGISNKDVFIWKNYTHEVTIYEYSNVTHENGTVETTDTNSYTEEQDFYDWYSIKNKFSTTVRNDHDWHFIRNTYWNQNQKRRLKFCFTAPLHKKEVKAKWHLFAKRSSDTIDEAISLGKYIKLDPYYAYGLATGLVAYYSYDTDGRDDVSGTYNGTVDDDVFHNTSEFKLGSASYYFNRSDDSHIGMPITLDISNEMTVAYWIRRDDNTVAVLPVHKWDKSTL